jgi:hypothetical protein
VSAPSAEGEAKPKARAIAAALEERAEQFLNLPSWEPAAFVLDLDEDRLAAGGHA